MKHWLEILCYVLIAVAVAIFVALILSISGCVFPRKGLEPQWDRAFHEPRTGMMGTDGVQE